MLCAVFGEEIISNYKKKRSAGYIDLMIAFESRKRSANPNKITSLNVALPFSFIDFYRRNIGHDVSIILSPSNNYILYYNVSRYFASLGLYF